MQKIMVIFGGKSVEHEISVITGVMAVNAIDKTVYDVIPIYYSKTGSWFTGKGLMNIESFKKFDESRFQRVTLLSGQKYLYEITGKKLKALSEIDCAINCCHGAEGENGSLSGLFNLCGIATASPDVTASGVAMDKSISKLVAKALGIKTIPALKISRGDYCKRKRIADKYISETICFPVIVKPARLGSSIGITTADSIESLEKAIEYAFLYDNIILVEKLIKNKREINCASYISDGEIFVSECEEPPLKSDFLTFEDKYMSGSKEERRIPADISKKISSKIKNITKQLYKRLNIKGVVRADFILEGEDVYFNELNTVPGSLAYYLFCKDVKELGGFIDCLIKQGIAAKEKDDKLLTSFSSDVIAKINQSGGKCLKKS